MVLATHSLPASRQLSQAGTIANERSAAEQDLYEHQVTEPAICRGCPQGVHPTSSETSDA
ncbi:uncharacterized protein MYCFIDRAFT_183936 [Pseudocercospora fijiensis CIRAD86]|uniref:Uncharacterized protein n=1 Tax=Pseudocercospora fijiensis (strain CIRAD86) TaxID=383855 RepID=M3AN95_PSEFD|nr:uncharacterized protein MYCFIDRAFT_183936 [Pseudocercospora fijiensis CIRAD86]EME78603.1 hypothetical protein MYCFIDRAFT_183936 [Pseudocercospora fijiensis CIRAD86]